MEVLKDPSSLAIFGVRGANGVIIVTTKRAKEGQTLVNINTSFGWKSVVDKIKMVNAPQFKELYNEQMANQGNALFDFSNWNANTDWQDEIFQTGFITNNNVSITGAFWNSGNEVYSPYSSLYTGATGVVRIAFRTVLLSAGSMRAPLNWKPTLMSLVIL